jgi:3'(2'), 5'-bisphosphate nucleotidase
VEPHVELSLSQTLETIKTVARMAGSLCQEIQTELVNPAEKDGREPVTIADYASQALICHALSENFPDDAVISEERSEEFMLLLSDQQRSLVQRFVTDALGGYVFEDDICAWLDYGKQKTASRTWVIDPIDGTKGFLGNRHYCVAIGLLLDGDPLMGVLASPGFYSDVESPPADLGALTYALRGHGAYREGLYSGEPHAIHVSGEHDAQRAILLTSYEPTHLNLSFIDRVVRALGRDADSPERRLDSQDKHAMLAAGMGDIYLRLAAEPAWREKLWDHTAGYMVVTEAGGRVTDIHGEPLDFTTGPRFNANYGVLMTNGHLHDELLDAIALSGF